MNQSKWEKIKETIKQKVSMPSYETWIKNLKYIQNDDVLIIVCPGDFHKSWIDSHYKSLIFDVVKEVNGESMEIEFVSEETAERSLEEEIIKEEDGAEKTLKMNQSKWDKIKEILKEQVSMPSYETWIKNLKYLQDDDVLIIVCSNDFQRGWIEKSYKTLFFETVKEVNGESIEIEFVSEEKTERSLENDTIKEDGTERALTEYLLKRVSELTDKVETLEKTVLKLMNNQSEINEE